MTAEVAQAWLPVLYMAERAEQVWGEALGKGKALRPEIALYVGGMGTRSRNFYKDVFSRYGFEHETERIQDLYLAGRKSEAAAAVPTSFVEATTLVGPEGFVRDRLQALKQSGVTSLNVEFLGESNGERIRHCEALKNLLVKENL
jgi:hypothetical protein